MKNSVIFSDWIISVPVPMVNLEDFKVFDMDKLLVDHAPLHEVVAAKNFETFPIHIDDVAHIAQEEKTNNVEDSEVIIVVTLGRWRMVK